MQKHRLPLKKINYTECLNWIIEHDKIRHITNRYFSVVCAKHNDQEHIMIEQTEIGLLGFIIAGQENDRHWLVQNKPEPGNINYYQLAPSVQATKSNYERVHGGKRTKFLELFLESPNMLVDIEGSEQGDRFLNKFNRICKVFSNTKFALEKKNFRWLSNDELKSKLQEDFTVNTDARSVIATGSWFLLTKNINEIFINSQLNDTLNKSLNNSYHCIDKNYLKNTTKLLNKIKNRHNNHYELIPIMEMKQHYHDSSGIFDYNNNPMISFFDVYFPEREVKSWQQPLLMRSTIEYCILVFHIFDGVAKFYLNVFPELGFNNRVELGPTFQTGTGLLKTDHNAIEDILKNVKIMLQIEQTDEGGRFYRNSCKYIFGQWTSSINGLSSDHGIWLTAGEIEKLSYHTGFMTNELRTTLSLLLSFA